MIFLNKKGLLKIIAILFLIIAFVYNHYSFLRIFLIFCSLFLIIYGINKKEIVKNILIILGSLILFYGVDFLSVKYLHRIPIFSYEKISSNKVATYNSLFYRVYNCNNNLIYDEFYKKNYQCDDDLPEEHINSLLSHVVSNYHEYHNKFVNVNGKISEISGTNSLSMQTFEVTEQSINGQVNFGNNLKLIILNHGNLEKIEDLKIYDTIQVIGRITNIKKKNQITEIYMKDAKIISRNSFDSYELKAVINKTCDDNLKLISKTDEYNYYTNCLNSIFVNYDEENRYELSYVLTDKRMSYETLIANKEKSENDNVELFSFNDFNLIKCKNSNNIIIGSKSLNLDTNYCEQFNTNVEEVIEEGLDKES